MTSQLKRGIITSLHTKKSQVFFILLSMRSRFTLFSKRLWFFGGLLLPKHPNKTEFRKWDLLYVKVNGGFSLSHWLTWSFRMNKAQKNLMELWELHERNPTLLCSFLTKGDTGHTWTKMRLNQTWVYLDSKGAMRTPFKRASNWAPTSYVCALAPTSL